MRVLRAPSRARARTPLRRLNRAQRNRTISSWRAPKAARIARGATNQVARRALTVTGVRTKNSAGRLQGVPKKAGRVATFKYKELLSTVTWTEPPFVTQPDNAAFLNTNFTSTATILNPLKESVFPSLAEKIKQYETYTVHSCTITYVPSCPNTTEGELILAYYRDPADVNIATDKGQLLRNQGTVKGPVWQPLRLTMPVPKNKFFVGSSGQQRNGNVQSSSLLRQEDFGQFVCSLSNVATALGTTVRQHFGELYIDYHISAQDITDPVAVSKPLTSDIVFYHHGDVVATAGANRNVSHWPSGAFTAGDPDYWNQRFDPGNVATFFQGPYASGTVRAGFLTYPLSDPHWMLDTKNQQGMTWVCKQAGFYMVIIAYGQQEDTTTPTPGRPIVPSYLTPAIDLSVGLDATTAGAPRYATLTGKPTLCLPDGSGGWTFQRAQPMICPTTGTAYPAYLPACPNIRQFACTVGPVGTFDSSETAIPVGVQAIVGANFINVLYVRATENARLVVPAGWAEQAPGSGNWYLCPFRIAIHQINADGDSNISRQCAPSVGNFAERFFPDA